MDDYKLAKLAKEYAELYIALQTYKSSKTQAQLTNSPMIVKKRKSAKLKAAKYTAEEAEEIVTKPNPTTGEKSFTPQYIQLDGEQVFQVSPRIIIPVNTKEEHTQFIPDESVFEDHNHLIEQAGIAINKRLPLLLIGDTGTGKTSLIRYLAGKTNNAFRRVNHNGGTTVDDVVGRTLLNKDGTIWVDGVLTEAMRKGYWYLADEINAAGADVLFAYHSLLDDDGYIVLPENGGEVVSPHPNFRFFAAMNPTQEYAGTKELNKALMSRFMVIKTDFPKPDIETKIVVDRTNIDPKVAENMIRFSAEIRANYAKEKIRFVLSTRDLLMWASMFSVYGKYVPAAETTILNKASNEDVESIKTMLSLHFKAIDERKAVTVNTSQSAFTVGDRVVAVAGAPYKITENGWVGVIKEIQPDGYQATVSSIVGNRTWEVDLRYFDKYVEPTL